MKKPNGFSRKSLAAAGGSGCIDGVPESLRRFSFSGNAGATSGDATTSPLLALEQPTWEQKIRSSTSKLSCKCNPGLTLSKIQNHQRLPSNG